MSGTEQTGQEIESSDSRVFSNPGLSPQALRAKRLEEQKDAIYEKIVNLSNDALATIEDIMHNGEKDSERLKAAQDLLNRGGMKQIQEISVTHTNKSSPSESIMEKINQLKPKEEPKQVEVIDALIEDDEESDQ